jgi:hypothetical protein
VGRVGEGRGSAKACRVERLGRIVVQEVIGKEAVWWVDLTADAMLQAGRIKVELITSSYTFLKNRLFPRENCLSCCLPRKQFCKARAGAVSSNMARMGA